MTFGWIRPFARDCWALAPDWRQIHKFMSTQALTLGSTVLGVLIAIEVSRALLLGVLAITFAATIAGALFKQPELEE